MILATTTSTQDSGLLDELGPWFKRETGVDVQVIAVGTGAALRMSSTGDADVVLAHAYAAEQEYVASGDLVEGVLVMHNDFVLVGPASDPADVAGASSLEEALARIAASGPFISRGDNSGTHRMELALWDEAAIEPAAVRNREETGQGMGATLNVADQRNGYTLTDRGTYLGLRTNLDLVVLWEGDRVLLNIYHAYLVNPAKHSGVKAEQGRAWLAFLVSGEVQEFIGNFRVEEFGEPLFTPDAGKDLEDLGD